MTEIGVTKDTPSPTVPHFLSIHLYSPYPTHFSMGVKQDNMGKTVPEIIAELEEFDRNSGQYWKTRIVEVLAQEVKETKKRHHKMNQYQQNYSYKLMREYGQILAAPVRVTNYKDMPYEELIERYKFRTEDAKTRKSMGYEFPWERTPTDFKKTFVNLYNKMSNRVSRQQSPGL
ncbi:hypothetical protein B9Z55_011563 [Caenorhabditis nigoni]|nr:hypothetical protein B9Z55_011563 [Caenorhabditis nigoni]